MGSDFTLNENIIQLPNGALRIGTAAIRKEFKRAGALHDEVLQFMRLLMVQISQTALCNRLHSVEERLARWLLLGHDRSATDELHLTQEFSAIMLGSNRATVTMSALTLQTIFTSNTRAVILQLQTAKDWKISSALVTKPSKMNMTTNQHSERLH